MSEISVSLWATLIPPVAREAGAERRGRQTRDPREARVREGSRSHSVLPSRGNPRLPGGALPAAGDQSPRRATLWCRRSPGPPRPFPAANAPGAQVWPGHQVQSALALCRLPSRAPAFKYLRVQRGHRHGRDKPGQLEGREGARLGGWA